MRITWKDGVTTLTTAAAVVTERAFSGNWGWPVVSDARGAILIVAFFGVVGFIMSWLLDADRSPTWSLTAGLIGSIAAVMLVFGLIYAASEFVVLLMLSVVAFWLAAAVKDLTAPTSMSHTHA